MSTTVNVDLEQPVAEKDKDATRIYKFDLTQLIPAGDSVLSCVWAPTTGVTIVSQALAGNVSTLKVSGGTASTWYPIVGTWVSASGEQDQIVLRLWIKPDAESITALGSALFPNRFTAVKRLRADRLVMAAQGALPQNADVSDDYLWDKLRAAESAVQHQLRVRFQAVAYFPTDPTQAQIDALPLNAPYEVDPGYDYEPEFFHSPGWGFLKVRHKPLISVSRVRINFPSATNSAFYDIPADWLRLDKKYGILQFVPTSGAGGTPLNAFMMSVLGMGRSVPFSIAVTYTAGLANPAADYPELLDAVLKKATLKVLEDRFFPQSGSISADGLSQSISTDMEKYRDTVDDVLLGGKGSNGGLMAAIHGIRMGVL
jgi:hypothetical protein